VLEQPDEFARLSRGDCRNPVFHAGERGLVGDWAVGDAPFERKFVVHTLSALAGGTSIWYVTQP